MIIEQTPGVESINEEIKYRLENGMKCPVLKKKTLAVPLFCFQRKQAAMTYA
ncbi:MAG: hypothetical protein ACLTTW_04290 [Coprobacter sp.]